MADPAGEGRRVCGMPEKAQLHVAMLALQFGYAGFHVVSRLALNMGISKLVFPVYRNIIALCLLVPFAYFLEKKDRPQLTLNFVLQFFFLALCGFYHGEPRVLPPGARQHLPDVRLGHPELGPGHHLRHGGGAADREGAAGPARRRGQGGGHAGVRGGGLRHHALQGPNNLRPIVRRRQAAAHHAYGSGGRRRDEELDAGLRVPDRSLPFVVGVAGAAGPRAQEVPGEAVGHLLHLLLRRHSVPHHRRLHGEGRRRMEVPLRIRALHNPIRRVHRFWRCVRCSDLVHRPWGPGVRGGVPAGADASGGHHGVAHPGRKVLPGRHHRRRAHHHRPLPRALGKEPGEGAPRQGRRRRRLAAGRGRRHHHRQERQAHAAAPAADLHRQRLIDLLYLLDRSIISVFLFSYLLLVNHMEHACIVIGVASDRYLC